MSVETKRTMIIVWRWKELNDEKPCDTVNVLKSSKDKIIRILKNEEALIIEKINEALIQGHTFIFLHRNHGFDNNSVDNLLKQLNTDKNRPHLLKCFLFGDGLDYLYYDTQDEGLLDHAGYFMYEREYPLEDEEGNIIYVEVDVMEEDENTKEAKLKLEHFDRVWDFYKGEFHKKINELMVDFIAEFVDLINSENNKTQFTAEDWKKKLENTNNPEGQFLDIRIKSFIEIINKDEKERLTKFEKEEKYSFVFDDCKGNFSNHPNVKVQKFYTQLFDKLSSIYEEDKEKAFSLNELRTLFLNLLKEIKPA